MADQFLIISDDFERSAAVVRAIGDGFDCLLLAPAELPARPESMPRAILIDIDLTDQDWVKHLGARIARTYPAVRRVALTNSSRILAFAGASVLRTNEVLGPPYVHETLLAALGASPRTGMAAGWAGRAEVEKTALYSATLLNDSILDALRDGGPLPKPQVEACGSMVTASLRERGIASWLEAVRQHHSYTHRHSLTVSGLAVAFALEYGVGGADVTRVARCALLHDVGKARIPVSILDKPTRLDADERREMDRHPEYGAEILISDGQFDPDVIDVARHHHECLDGTGYPDGLRADQISDLVRMITVVDIFSALVDQRAYKKPMRAGEAYAILEGMAGKIDMDILRAFKPVALREPPAFDEGFARQVAGG